MSLEVSVMAYGYGCNDEERRKGHKRNLLPVEAEREG
jgi:hypothetical protein